MTAANLKKTCRYLTAAARRVWRWNEDRGVINREAEKLAGSSKKRQCSQCLQSFERKKVHVDHIIPVGAAPKSFSGWDEFYVRLFSPRTNLQSLCTTCHKLKSAGEATARAKARKAA